MLKRIILALLLTASGFAQTTGPVLSLGAPVRGEFTATVNVVLATNGASIAALQFTLPAPAAPVTAVVVAGPALSLAQKQLSCGTLRCIAVGSNQTLIADGVVATITLTSTSSATLSDTLSDLEGASTEGNVITMTTPGPVAVSLTSRCDLNGDGKTDIADVAGAVVQAIGGAACGSADLTGRGKCDVVDLQRIVNAAVGGTCRFGM